MIQMKGPIQVQFAPVMLAKTKDTLLAHATRGFKEMLESSWGKVNSAWADMNVISGPLPVYCAEDEAAFVKEMLAADRVAKLSTAVDNLQAKLHDYQEIASVFGLANEDATKATEAAKHELSKVCSVTCLRILTSKSAQMLAPALQQPITASMEFAKTNSLDMPGDIFARMEKLLSAITEASAPKRRRIPKQ